MACGNSQDIEFGYGITRAVAMMMAGFDTGNNHFISYGHLEALNSLKVQNRAAFVDRSNFEQGFFRYNSGTATFQIGTEKAGTGSVRDLDVIVGSTKVVQFHESGIFAFFNPNMTLMPVDGSGVRFDFSFNGVQYSNIEGLGMSWSNSINATIDKHVGIYAYADELGVVQVNSSIKGDFRDLKLRALLLDRVDTGSSALSQTIDAYAGSFLNVPPSNSVVITNMYVTPASSVLAQMHDPDSSNYVTYVLCGSGYFEVFYANYPAATTRTSFILLN
jgi:hypothetical protein